MNLVTVPRFTPSTVVLTAILWVFSLASAQAAYNASTNLAGMKYLSIPLGTLQHDFDTTVPVAGYIAQGSISTPITDPTLGSTFSITRYQNLSNFCGGGQNDTECSSCLNIIVYDGTTDYGILSALNLTAVGQSTIAGSNVQALNCQGYVNGSGTQTAGCGFMLGKRNTATGIAEGVEISAWNNTNTTCFLTYGTAGVAGSPGGCDGIWLSARGLSSTYIESAAMHIGLGDNAGQWAEGVTVNKGAVATYAFDDQSSSVYSFLSNGTHTSSFHSASGSTYAFDIGGTHTTGLGASTATLTDLVDGSAATISRSLIRGPSSALNANGALILGINTLTTIGGISPTPQLQSYAASDGLASGVFGQFTADAFGPALNEYKSRATTIGGHAAVVANDNLGLINFYGDDGTNAIGAASIQGFAMGTISTGIVPGKIVLRTANTSGTLTQGFVLDDAQAGYVGSAGAIELFDAIGNLYGQGVKGVTCTNPLTVVSSITIKGGAITAATGTGGTCS